MSIAVWSESERHGIKWNCPPHVRRYGEEGNVEDVSFEGGPVKDPREAYRGVWSAIHGASSWEANSWVWVVEFRRVARIPRTPQICSPGRQRRIHQFARPLEPIHIHWVLRGREVI